MDKKDIYILGVGNNTGVYMDLVESCGYRIAGLIHYNQDRVGEEYMGEMISMSNDDLFEQESLQGMNFALSMGNNRIRRKIAQKIRDNGGRLPTLIHPTAVVSTRAIINEGVVVHANSVVQASTSIGQDSVLSYNVSLTHSSNLGCGVYLAAGSNIGAYVQINDFVLVGQGAIIVSAKVDTIGTNSTIGAGSVVVNNIPDNVIVKGQPAKIFKKL